MYPFRAVISYDGTRYFGWQKTDTGPTIQASIALAITKASQEEILPEAASRTDRGVHAEGQVISFALQKKWDPYRLLRALNAHLPKDIRILLLKEASSDFHPTLQSRLKEYHYRISMSPFQEPFDRLYAWHFRWPLDLSLMEKAAKQLIGERDFSAFAGEKETNPICTLTEILFQKLDRERLQIVIQGDRFLYKMARTLVGTLLYIGSHKLDTDCLPSILSLKDRKKAGITAPAHGLFLHRVLY